MILKKQVGLSFLLLLLTWTLLPIYTALAASTVIAVDPQNSVINVGATFSVDINVTNVSNLASWQFKLYYLNSVVNCTGVTEGSFLNSVGGTYFSENVTNNFNSTHGRILAYCSFYGSNSVNGSGVLATAQFQALGAGDSSLHLSETKLYDSNMPPIPIDHTDTDGAVQVQNLYTLTVSTTGQGYVTLNNTGPYYHYGDVILLTAVPFVSWNFSHWSGNLTGTTNPAILVITDNMSVTATFIQNAYTLSVIVSGSGSVNLNDSGPYNYGASVLLTAVPSIGWSFNHWSGNLTGSANPATLLMTDNMSVTATFTQNTYTLTVNIVGSGSVNLNSTGPYHYGDAVLLTAMPDGNWVFHYWSGDLSGSVNPAAIVIISSYSITAHFIQKPTLQMSPAGKTCRVYGETFAVTINVSNAVNVEDLKFEIHYNATLLDCIGYTWNAWGTGTITVDDVADKITGYTSGAPLNGTQTLLTLRFQASFQHIWKNATGWTNDLTSTIYLQWANLSYPTDPDLRYDKGGSSQINVGPDFAYTFSPIQGDIDNNGIVNIFDVRTVAYFYGKTSLQYDLNGENPVDISDIVLISANFGYTYSP